MYKNLLITRTFVETVKRYCKKNKEILITSMSVFSFHIAKWKESREQIMEGTCSIGSQESKVFSKNITNKAVT